MADEAIQLFEQVPRQLRDSHIYVSVLNACSHAGLIDQAETIFNEIPAEKLNEQIYTTAVKERLAELIESKILSHCRRSMA